LVREVLALPMEDVVRLQETWSEDAAAFLDGMKPFLFVIGFLLLILEFKTPGFALPGALGLLLLGLAMFGSYLTGLAEFTEILLFFAGIGLIAVEVFVMPGMIVFGALGFLALVFGLIASQQTFVVPATAAERDILLDNLLNMTWLILLVVAGAVALWRLLPHIPVLNRVLLQPPDPAAYRLAGTPGGGFVDLSRWIGREAQTVTDLRPAGIAEIDGERLDAVAEGGFVARGTRVRIVAARLNQVVVEPAGSPAGERGEIAIGFLVLLLMIGLALTLAEIFFLSFGILGTLAAVSLVSSVFLAFTNHGQAVGFLFLAVASIGAPLVVLYGMKWLPHTRLGRALILSGPTSAEVTGAGADPGLGALLGRSGAAESDLRPAGIARIDGRRIDVVTRGEMLERGTPLRVVDVTANRVVVARHAPASE
jgi:membrane-bound ClpP family serine protease